MKPFSWSSQNIVSIWAHIRLCKLAKSLVPVTCKFQVTWNLVSYISDLSVLTVKNTFIEETVTGTQHKMRWCLQWVSSWYPSVKVWLRPHWILSHLPGLFCAYAWGGQLMPPCHRDVTCKPMFMKGDWYPRMPIAYQATEDTWPCFHKTSWQ